MNILLCSHAAWRTTGYGGPVLPVIKQWRKLSHEAAVLAVEERGPGMLEYRGVRHYLPRQVWTGEDTIARIADDCKADLIVSLLDPWSLVTVRGYAAAGRKWLAWCPIDQEPPQFGLVERLGQAALTLSFSQWGVDVLKQYAPDLPVKAMPIGIDLDTFKPNDAREKYRETMGIPAEAFVVGMVGTNMRGDRKALVENIAGFCEFAKTRPDAYLVLWTTPLGGMDLQRYVGQLKGAQNIRLVNPWLVEYGAPASELADFYNSLDVLLHASAAEGFGLPILEAMACGTPVIGARNSSMTELVSERAGWLVNDLTPQWSFLGGWWNRPTPQGVAQTLRMAREDIAVFRPMPRPFMDGCRGIARAYGWDMVGDQWADVFAAL